MIGLDSISEDLGTFSNISNLDLNVILDNNTRWNSTFLSLSRAIKIRRRLDLFCYDYRNELHQDQLDDDEWHHLESVVKGLQPFHEVTLALEGLAHNGYFGSIWEALPALAVLLQKMEEGLNEARAANPRNPQNRLAVAYQGAWEKLQKYYSLTDEAHGIYAAAILLHPAYRKKYFDVHWQGEEQQWKDLAIQNVRTIWENEYKPFLPTNEEEAATQVQQQHLNVVQQYMRQAQMPRVPAGSEFDSYINGLQTDFGTPHDCIPWLRSRQNPWPGITQHALDLISIPAMSAELERVFSRSKLTVTPLRNRLSDTSIEILELMSYWWTNNIISQPRGKRQRQ